MIELLFMLLPTGSQYRGRSRPIWEERQPLVGIKLFNELNYFSFLLLLINLCVYIFIFSLPVDFLLFISFVFFLDIKGL